MLQDLTNLGIPLATLGVIVTFVWYANSWLNRQFSETKKLIFDKLEEMKASILDKMDYHERHDDQRFHDMSNDIWAIKIRNAAIDGRVGQTVVKKEKPGH